MNRSNIWRIPACIVLTVLAIVLFVGGAGRFVLYDSLSEKTLKKLVEPFDLSNIVSDTGISYRADLTGRFNEELLALAKRTAMQQGYTDDAALVYRNVLTEDDVEDCVGTKEFENTVVSKSKQYFASLRNQKKSVSLNAEELMQLKCIRQLQTCINEKLSSVDADVAVTVSDGQMEDILNNILDDYGLRGVFAAESLAETKAALKTLKTPARWAYRFLIDRLFNDNIVAILMLIGACLCLIAIGCLRYKQLARAAMYGIVTLTVSAGIVCLVGLVISGISTAISSFDFFGLNMPFAVDTVVSFIAWSIVVFRDLFFSKALWFLAGTVPFWALEIWYYIDKKHVERMTQAVRHRMSYEDE